jgi:hypothetical protein
MSAEANPGAVADAATSGVPTTMMEAMAVLHFFCVDNYAEISVIDNAITQAREKPGQADNVSRKACYGVLARVAGGVRPLSHSTRDFSYITSCHPRSPSQRGKGDRVDLGDTANAAVRVIFPGNGEYMGFKAT